MGAIAPGLPDSAARLTALIDHDHTLLVEAGAGSGKTALMAGRVAMLLTAGVPPVDQSVFSRLASAIDDFTAWYNGCLVVEGKTAEVVTDLARIAGIALLSH
jgi:hypothetical protein